LAKVLGGLEDAYGEDYGELSRPYLWYDEASLKWVTDRRKEARVNKAEEARLKAEEVAEEAAMDILRTVDTDVDPLEGEPHWNSDWRPDWWDL
jgi:hypothetical protein